MNSHLKITLPSLLGSCAVIAGLLIGIAPASAQTAAPAPSSNAMINLVRLLVAQGTISKDKGEALIAEALREAQEAFASASAARPAAVPGNPADPLTGTVFAGTLQQTGGVVAVVQTPKGQILYLAPNSEIAGWRLTELLPDGVRLARDNAVITVRYGEPAAPPALPPSAFAAAPGGTGSAAVRAGGTQVAALPPPPAGTIRVPFIPESVRKQIRDELKTDVLAQATREGWASPGRAAPEWTRNVRFHGDFRIRSQSALFSAFNSTQIPNFRSIVNSGPLDLINSQIPILNTTKDLYGNLLLRARFGIDFTVDPRIMIGVELSTGNDNSPVSASTPLGDGFTKRPFYLQKAFVEARVTDNLTVTAGRMVNPFLATPALFDPEVRLDGVAFEARTDLSFIGIESLKLRGGAFPLGFGNLNFPNTATTKLGVPQKWLFSGQIETGATLPRIGQLTFAAGYHHYLNISGQPSAPCALYLGATECSTDNSAAFSVQNGNTLSFVRRIVADPTLPSTIVQPQPQLLGLTMSYHILNATAVFTMPLGKTKEFSFIADYLRNLGFRRADVCRFGLAGQPVNNGGSGGSGNICDPTPARRTPFVGGANGYDLLASYGNPIPRNRGEWRVFAGYKYIESDAVLDAVADREFHLGGTNAKGLIVGGVLGLRRNTTFGARWLSANQVSGEPFAVDVLQLDMNVAF